MLGFLVWLHFSRPCAMHADSPGCPGSQRLQSGTGLKTFRLIGRAVAQYDAVLSRARLPAGFTKIYLAAMPGAGTGAGRPHSIWHMAGLLENLVIAATPSGSS
jgi:hypothetical protein